jgi:hypothetical protein
VSKTGLNRGPETLNPIDQQDQCDQRTSFFPLLKAGLPRREDGEFYPLMKMIFADKMASLSL